MNQYPAQTPRAICLTFDNLGEAAELEAGIWAADVPVGNHASITHGLPWLLNALGERPASFFVEGWSAQTYPEAVKSIDRAGKEVGVHGWRHEQWLNIGARERESLVQARTAFEDIGVDVRGFRPPGGPPSHETMALLPGLEFDYLSCLGKGAGVAAGMPVIPYDWNCVDALYLEPYLTKLRLSNGLSQEVYPPSVFASMVESRVDDLRDTAGILVVLWHPYLLIEDGHRSAFLETLDAIDRSGVPLVSCRDAANLIRNSLLRDVAPIIDGSGW
jgi:peptidoglycan/xylan/chitin deacetylase (PgdA/CDA1 family)